MSNHEKALALAESWVAGSAVVIVVPSVSVVAAAYVEDHAEVARLRKALADIRDCLDGKATMRGIATVALLTEPAPDENCITLPNGDCVGGPCMHDPREPTPNQHAFKPNHMGVCEYCHQPIWDKVHPESARYYKTAGEAPRETETPEHARERRERYARYADELLEGSDTVSFNAADIIAAMEAAAARKGDPCT